MYIIISFLSKRPSCEPSSWLPLSLPCVNMAWGPAIHRGAGNRNNIVSMKTEVEDTQWITDGIFMLEISLIFWQTLLKRANLPRYIITQHEYRNAQSGVAVWAGPALCYCINTQLRKRQEELKGFKNILNGGKKSSFHDHLCSRLILNPSSPKKTPGYFQR